MNWTRNFHHWWESHPFWGDGVAFQRILKFVWQHVVSHTLLELFKWPCYIVWPFFFFLEIILLQWKLRIEIWSNEVIVWSQLHLVYCFFFSFFYKSLYNKIPAIRRQFWWSQGPCAEIPNLAMMSEQYYFVSLKN